MSAPTNPGTVVVVVEELVDDVVELLDDVDEVDEVVLPGVAVAAPPVTAARALTRPYP